MPDYNPRNERTKRAYIRFLREADQKAEATVRGIEKALLRFETHTGFADFSTFNSKQAIGFKKVLMGSSPARSGKALGAGTIRSTLNNLKRFFKWLAYEPGFKKKIRLSDIEFLNLPANEDRAAAAARFRDYPSIEQVRHVIATMRVETEVERRNRALIALMLLTGMRDSAAASLRLKHVDLTCKLVMQDPREVRTKFRKRIDTYFLPLGQDLEDIVSGWVRYLVDVKLWSPNDPVFPSTAVGQNAERSFAVQGVEPTFWSTTTPIREIFKRTFERAGLAYFNPHSIRHTVVAWAEGYYRSPEEFKAFSQNIGHEDVLTTFQYGRISLNRQGQLIRNPQVRGIEGAEVNELLSLLRQRISEATS